tara:strand:- start:146 stop:475 length:330 start_codon:yes stop_codon:yes gene_type:complete
MKSLLGSRDGSLEQLKAEIEAASPYNDGWTRQHYAEKAEILKNENAEQEVDLKERLEAPKEDYVIQLGKGDVKHLQAFNDRNFAGIDHRVTFEIFARITKQILDIKVKV